MSEVLLHPLYIKKYIENNVIFKFKRLNKNKPKHRLCGEIIERISKWYIKNRNIKSVAQKLDVSPAKLRNFLLKADRMRVINYETLKHQSKYPGIPSNMGIDEKLVKKIARKMKTCYSIKKVAESLNLPFGKVRDLLFTTYKCKNISDLRWKIKIKRIPSEDKIAKLKKVKEIYDECFTLEKTAERLNITRERVRQLLEEGERCGIFEYELSREKRFKEIAQKYNRDSIINEIKMLISPSKICMKLNIKDSDFHKLLEYFNIDYSDYRRAAVMGKHLEKYSQIVDTLGHHPTTTEMNSRREWRTVWGAIDRLWGNMDNFRKEFGIEKPKHRIHPSTTAFWKKAMERRIQIKKEKKERILNFIKEQSPVNAGSICNKLGFSRGSTNGYLDELSEEGLISKVGGGSYTKYVINQSLPQP